MRSLNGDPFLISILLAVSMEKCAYTRILSFLIQPLTRRSQGKTVVFDGLLIVLNHEVMQHMSMNIRKSKAPALDFEGELFVVDAHQIH